MSKLDELESLIKQLDKADANGARQIVDRMREVRNGITNPSHNGNGKPKGKKTMNENDQGNWIENLSPEENQELLRDVEAARLKIEARRTQAAQAQLNLQYNQAMAALFAKGRPSLQERMTVRQHFRSLGLTDFTAKVVNNG